ncbi:MAG TPA: hypothetical protein VGK67_27585 [Myxococcales bacterium]|jgi:hypothetical protein
MRRTVLLLVGLGLAACGSTVADGGRDGGFKRDTGGGDAGDDIVLVRPDASTPKPDTGWVDPCPPEAKLIYVVDTDDTFSSFDPKLLKTGGDPFHDLGTLNCPAGSATPFSMSVDRKAVAWVLYNDGQVFTVNTTTLACSPTSYTVRPDLKLFGMGFVSNSPGSLEETLFVAGGAAVSTTSSTLARMQLVPSMKLFDLGTVAGSPELTGTGDGNLWGFFPNKDSPKVSQIDKTTGGDLKTFTASAIAGDPSAWAFAFWGGDFFIFLKRDADSSTQVHQMSSKTGTLTTPLPDTGRRIVGAGVSTCAPTDPT